MFCFVLSAICDEQYNNNTTIVVAGRVGDKFYANSIYTVIRLVGKHLVPITHHHIQLKVREQCHMANGLGMNFYMLYYRIHLIPLFLLVISSIASLYVAPGRVALPCEHTYHWELYYPRNVCQFASI